MKKQVKIFDTTLRDGEQSPGCSMNFQEKMEMAKQLERLGVSVIEAGFPMSSPEDFASVQAIAREIKGCTVAGLSRCTKGDIDRTYECLKGIPNARIHVFLATSPIHMQYKLNMTPDQVVERVREMVSYSHQFFTDIEFSAEDASRSDREFLVKVFRTAIECGATTINIPDTVGYATPDEMYDLVKYVKDGIADLGDIDISVHCHNDLGLAVANSLASISAGATQVECTVNGIGERAGNASLEEIVMALRTRADVFQMETGINTKQIYRSSKMLSTITGVPIAPTKAIVGANAFAHEAGIHQHGVLKERTTYEIMTPESVGIYKNAIILGKHSGKHAFEERLEELGYKLTPDEIAAGFERFKQLADRKKDISDKDIEALVSSASYQIPETYSLVSFVVNSGTVISATAVVKLMRDGKEYEHVARGEGPVDASFKAIDRIVKQDYVLESYHINAVTEGEDALGEVVVKIKNGDDVVTGRGLSPDIVEASIRAYLNAVNKTLAN